MCCGRTRNRPASKLLANYRRATGEDVWICTRIPSDPRRRQQSGSLYVSELPGEGGKDWGYSNSKYRLLSDHWKRRFENAMHRFGDKAHCFKASPAQIAKQRSGSASY